ncbi:MAG: oligosaccharide flippase family protein [Bacteroidales bacterium]|nr:oligosaccharide flippase family protein [Bacteroidales bacterium]
MNPLKQLAGQTAIYGLGTIVPRLLNYLLVPLYTRLFLGDEYGVITELYAYIAFFFVLLLYGMETSFFRHAEKGNPKKVFSTSLISIFFTSLLFIILVIVFIDPISVLMKYPQSQDLIIYSAIIIGIDAFTAIQFAYLRQQNKPIRFSLIRIITVSINVGLNLYFIWICDILYKSNPDSSFLFFYNPEIRIGYVFISNLVASIVAVILLLPQILKIKIVLDPDLLKRMLVYAFPLLIVGLAGMINEVSDKIIFKYLAKVPEGIVDADKYIMGQLGIYGANYKLAVLMTLFIQMFRYAAEPFFFSQAKENNAKQVYADVMKYFVIFGLLIFLAVTLYIDIFKYFIGPEFWEGLFIVPIVLLANLFLGIFFNLSVWYKLNDITKYGAIIALVGSGITILMNILLVPKYGYLGAAWGHFACYLSMMIISYFWGRKHYPVKYDLNKILFYIAVALIVFGLSRILNIQELSLRLLVNSIMIVLFLSVVYFGEKPDLKPISKKKQ